MANWISRAIRRFSSMSWFFARNSSRLRASSALARRIRSSARCCSRDVPEDALQTDDLAVRAVERGFDDAGDAFVLSQRVMFLGDFIGLAGLHHALVVPGVLLRQFLREKIKIRFAQNVLQLAVVMLAVLLVGKSEPALQVLPKDVLRHRFHQRMVKRFRVLAAPPPSAGVA